MGKIRIIIALLLLVTVAALPFVYLRNTETVTVTHLKKAAYQHTLEVVGNIEAAEYTPVKLSYPVYIKESFVKENSYVNKGQLMFTLDIEKMESAIKEYDFTQYVDAGISMDKSVIMNVSKEIYASDSGVVKNLTAADGDIILSDENLCVIESDSDIMVKITLNQEDYSRVAVGDKIQFSPDIAPDRIYTATINRKTAQIRKEKSLTGNKTVVDVFADIDKIDDCIISGLEVSGTIMKPVKEMFTLPYDYINQDDGGEYVTVLENGKDCKEYIETGMEMDNCAEILTIFDENTLFIKNNQILKGNSLLKYEN